MVRNKDQRQEGAKIVGVLVVVKVYVGRHLI